MPNATLSDLVASVKDALVLLEAADRVQNQALRLDLITSAHARLKVAADETRLLT